MKWPAMTSLPCFDSMRSVLTGNISRDYHALSMYSPGMQVISGTVYFATAEDYLRDLPTDVEAGFVLLCESPKQKIKINSNQNVCRFDDKQAFDNCFKELKKEFRFEESLVNGIQQLIMMAADNDPLDKMVQYIAQLFGCHVTVIDSSYTYRAHSEGIEELSPQLGSDVANGRVDPEIQLKLKETGIFHPMGIRRRTTSFESILTTHDGEPVFNNATLIYSGLAIVGSISLFTIGEPLLRTRIHFMPIIASVLSMEFQHSDYWIENKGAFYTQLLTSFVNNEQAKNMEETDARLRFKAAGYDLDYYKYVTFFDLSEESFTIREAQSLAMEVKQGIPNTIFYIENGNIVFFTSSDEFITTDDFEDLLVAQVQNTGLDSTLVRVGLSSCFTKIVEIRSYYLQAKRCIEIGRDMGRKKDVYSYDKMRLFDMFSYLPEHSDMYLYPPLVGLIREDQRKGTQLSFTLYEYLKDPEHIQDICKLLGIHKNTLYFRLNKAREIMHHDYKDGNVAMEIMLSFRLLEYHGLFKHMIIDTKKRKAEKQTL